jgi:hypothetical protein
MHEDHNTSELRQRVPQLGYLGIGVSDLAAWKDFAVNVLRLQEGGWAADGSRMGLCSFDWTATTIACGSSRCST